MAAKLAGEAAAASAATAAEEEAAAQRKADGAKAEAAAKVILCFCLPSAEGIDPYDITTTVKKSPL